MAAQFLLPGHTLEWRSYAGVLSSHGKWRSRIVQKAVAEGPGEVIPGAEAQPVE